jgi:hypothetical protein
MLWTEWVEDQGFFHYHAVGHDTDECCGTRGKFPRRIPISLPPSWLRRGVWEVKQVKLIPGIALLLLVNGVRE